MSVVFLSLFFQWFGDNLPQFNNNMINIAVNNILHNNDININPISKNDPPIKSKLLCAIYLIK